MDIALVGSQSGRIGNSRECCCGDHSGCVTKNELAPHKKKQWCIGTIHAVYIARMENLLHLYAQAPNPKRPRICYDERPCQLLGDVLSALPMQAHKPLREHYEYERHGVVHALLAYNLDTGQRYVHLRRRRRAEEYAHFMAGLAADYPDAEAIDLIQDNLNIHDPASFYKVFDAETALKLTHRFTWHYTPKHASWLNMAELEFSAYARECANQRWSSLNAFVEGSRIYFTERNTAGGIINWKFNNYHARDVFKKHYELVTTS
jgi:hypothetical protein